MRIKLKDRDYSIHFKHEPRVTTALIDEHLFPYYRLAEGRAFCSPQDNFSKVKGRKIALARALQIWLPNTQPGYRDNRREVWRQLVEGGMRIVPRK